MRNFFTTLFVAFTVFIPSFTFAANVGFVPSTGVWFSTTTFNPKETVRVYTVVFNNDYLSLDGAIGFYDNNELIETAEFKGLSKESAQQLRIFWQPTEGSHVVQARFIRANTTDATGQKTDLALETISNVSGLPLSVGATSVSPVDSVATGSGGTSAPQSAVVGSVAITITPENGKLAMAPQVLGEKITQREHAGTTGSASVTASGTDFSENHDLFNKAQGMAATITTTVGKITDAYNQTKSVIEQGQAYYQMGKEKIAIAQPYFEKAKEGWLKITDNNNPKRVIAVVCAVVLGWLLIKFAFRRRRRRLYDEFE